MKTIWKYPLMITTEQEVSHPENWTPLYVAMQHGIPTLWAEVDPENSVGDSKIYLTATGAAVPRGTTYLGTFFTHDDLLVWHTYWKDN